MKNAVDYHPGPVALSTTDGDLFTIRFFFRSDSTVHENTRPCFQLDQKAKIKVGLNTFPWKKTLWSKFRPFVGLVVWISGWLKLFNSAKS